MGAYYRLVSRLPLEMRQFIKFSFVGVGNTVIDFGVYFVLTRSFVFFASNYLLANFISFLMAVIFSFTLNKYWTFRAHTRTIWAQYVRFIAVSVVALMIAQTLLYILVSVVSLHDLVAKAITTVVVVFWNFFLNKFWTFSER